MLNVPINQMPSGKSDFWSNGLFLLHATVSEISDGDAANDTATMDKLVRRRLVRLERVLSAYGCRDVRPIVHGLQANFRSVEAAVQAACEMQRQCAVIPQISATRLVLRIGIVPVEGGAEGDGAALAGHKASQLSELRKEACVVVASELLGTMPSELCELSAPLDQHAQVVDWPAVPVKPLPRDDSPILAGLEHAVATVRQRLLLLSRGEFSFHFPAERPVVTVGREPSCDLVVDDRRASRHHGRIVRGVEGFTLVDLSTNGTSVRSDADTHVLVHKNIFALPDRGWINFGNPADPAGEQTFRFEIVE